MMGRGFSPDDLRSSIGNISAVIETAKTETVVLDHHLLRDLHWRDHLAEVFAKAGKRGRRIVTAAGFLGREDEALEAKRKRALRAVP